MAAKIHANPQEIETAFYAALEASDLEAMMAVWSEDEEIVCVHPGGPRLIGYHAVRESWRLVFAAGERLNLRVIPQSVVTTPFAVISHVLELVGQQDEPQRFAPIAATNIYVRGLLGWRLVAHHASALPPGSLIDTPKVLH